MYLLLRTSSCIFFSKREKTLANQEVFCLLNCEFPEHKVKGSLRCSEVVKGFYKVSGKLKWVAWRLEVGTGSGGTRINWVCISLFLILIYFIYLAHLKYSVDITFIFIYLVEIKCMMNLLVTKVAKFIRLFNSKLMIISITHKIMDVKLYDYWFLSNWNSLL